MTKYFFSILFLFFCFSSFSQVVPRIDAFKMDGHVINGISDDTTSAEIDSLMTQRAIKELITAGFRFFHIAGDAGVDKIQKGDTVKIVGGTGVQTLMLNPDEIIVDFNGGLNDITDVIITSPNDGDILSYNSGIWENAPSDTVTKLTQDSILIYTLNDVEVLRDTIRTPGGGSGDNLGNHIMTQNIETAGNYISYDGTNTGLQITNTQNLSYKDFVPNVGATLDLGKSTLGWANVYSDVFKTGGLKLEYLSIKNDLAGDTYSGIISLPSASTQWQYKSGQNDGDGGFHDFEVDGTSVLKIQDSLLFSPNYDRTGTASKWWAIDASGNWILENPPVSGAAPDQDLSISSDSLILSHSSGNNDTIPIPFSCHRASNFGAIGDGTTDDWQALQTMIDSAGSNSCIELQRGNIYKITSTLDLNNISDLAINGNKATIKRCDASEVSTTLSVAYTAGSGTSITVSSVPSNYRVGDDLVLITGERYDSITVDARTITDITGNVITVNSSFSATIAGQTVFPIGTTVKKDFYLITGGDYNKNVHIDNVIFDGNHANNQVNHSWTLDGAMYLAGSGSSITNCKFKDIGNECIIGHGLTIDNNHFENGDGSAFHTSVHDDYYNNAIASFFTNNIVENFNRVANSLTNHSEGAVTFSWNGGNIAITDNYFDGGSDYVFGGIGAATGANSDENFIISNNHCFDYNGIFSSVSASTENVNVSGNTFSNCGSNDFSSLSSNSEILFCGNLATNGTTITIHDNNNCTSTVPDAIWSQDTDETVSLVDNNDRVGIGSVASSTAQLYVRKDGTVASPIPVLRLLGYTTNFKFMELGRDDGTMYIESQYSDLALNANTGAGGGAGSDFTIEAATGDVGIGTTTPTVDLHVIDSTSDAKFKVEAVNTGNVAASIIYENGDSDAWLTGLLNSADIGQRTAFQVYNSSLIGDERYMLHMRMGDYGGNLGMKTASPLFGVDINDSLRVRTLPVSSSLDDILVIDANNVFHQRTAASLGLGTHTDNYVPYGDGTNTFDENEKLQFVDDSRLKVGTGNVFTPPTTYDDIVINNTVNPGLTIMSTDASAAGIRFASPTRTTGYAFVSATHNDVMNIGTNYTSSYIRFLTSTYQERMRITSGGDVGIGLTPSGSYILEVNDDAKIDGTCTITGTIWLNSAETVGIFTGSGTPEGSVSASVGSTYHRTDGGSGTSFYVKESGTGNTGWVAK